MNLNGFVTHRTWQVLAVATIALIFLPHIMKIEFENIDDSTMARALESSIILPLVHYFGLISVTLTMLDIALNKKYHVNVGDSIERVYFVVSLIFPSILFFALRGNSFFPYVYWNIRSAHIAVKVISVCSVGTRLYPKSFPV